MRTSAIVGAYSVVFARDCRFLGKSFRKGEVLEIPEVEGLMAENLDLKTSVECIEFMLDMYMPDDYTRDQGMPFEIFPTPSDDDLARVRVLLERESPHIMFSWRDYATSDAA